MKKSDHNYNVESHDPYLFTDVVRQKYLTLLMDGYGRLVAADTVGISERTVRRYYRGNPGFLIDMEMAERRVIDNARKTLISIALEERDFQALKFLLERLDRPTWGDRRDVKVSVDGKIEHLLELSPAEGLEAIETQIAERQLALAEGGELFDTADDSIVDAEIVEEDEPTQEQEIPAPGNPPAANDNVPWETQ